MILTNAAILAAGRLVHHAVWWGVYACSQTCKTQFGYLTLIGNWQSIRSVRQQVLKIGNKREMIWVARTIFSASITGDPPIQMIGQYGNQ